MREGCELCRNQKDRELPDRGADEFVLSDGTLWWIGYDEMPGIEINFCPWCGRPLQGDKKEE